MRKYRPSQMAFSQYMDLPFAFHPSSAGFLSHNPHFHDASLPQDNLSHANLRNFRTHRIGSAVAHTICALARRSTLHANPTQRRCLVRSASPTRPTAKPPAVYLHARPSAAQPTRASSQMPKVPRALAGIVTYEIVPLHCAYLKQACAESAPRSCM
jgi:hypothetical protein